MQSDKRTYRTLSFANTNTIPWYYFDFDGVYKIENMYLKLKGLIYIKYSIHYVIYKFIIYI